MLTTHRSWRESSPRSRRPASSSPSTPTTSTSGCSTVVKREGPWPNIISHHFETVDELIATISGVVPPDHGLTLDDIAGPHFRGFFAKNSVCFYPELEDIFYNARFLAEVKSYWDVPVREADADAVQHLRTARHRPRRRTSTP